MKVLTQELRNLYEEIVAKEKIELHLKNIDRQLLEKEAEQKRAIESVRREEMDVKKLEKKSLFSVFQFILGNKEEQKEKERQEYLQAYLAHQAICNSLTELKKEKALLLQNYSSKFNMEKEFDELVKAKVEQIRALYPKLVDDIIHFEERIVRNTSKIKEIRQAIREGKKTIRMLQRILVNLEKYEHWGHGRSKRNKTNRIRTKDRIQKDIYKVDNHLQKFEKELFDVSDHYTMDYTQQIEETKDFLFFFYDSLISDWVIKERIENSVNIINNFADKILRIISMLESEIIQTQSYIKLEKKDQRLLIMQKLKLKGK